MNWRKEMALQREQFFGLLPRPDEIVFIIFVGMIVAVIVGLYSLLATISEIIF